MIYTSHFDHSLFQFLDDHIARQHGTDFIFRFEGLEGKAKKALSSVPNFLFNIQESQTEIAMKMLVPVRTNRIITLSGHKTASRESSH